MLPVTNELEAPTVETMKKIKLESRKGFEQLTVWGFLDCQNKNLSRKPSYFHAMARTISGIYPVFWRRAQLRHCQSGRILN